MRLVPTSGSSTRKLSRADLTARYERAVALLKQVLLRDNTLFGDALDGEIREYLDAVEQ